MNSDLASDVPFRDRYAVLDDKEQRFVDLRLAGFNQTRAARMIWGHRSSKQQGYKVMQRADVAATIKAGLRERSPKLDYFG